MGTFELFLRTLLALGIVLGLVWVLARVSGRAQGGGGRRRRLGGRGLSASGTSQGPRVTVLTKRSLSRTAAITVVRVGDRDLVLGTTAQSITLIAELPAPAESDGIGETPATTAGTDSPWKATSGESPMAWEAVITTLREKTTRR
jgi:flagellar protein FliO/FliZ